MNLKVIKKYQKNNVPPRTKVRGLTGTCFLDARSVPHTKVCGLQTLRHKDKTWEAQVVVDV